MSGLSSCFLTLKCQFMWSWRVYFYKMRQNPIKQDEYKSPDFQ